MDESAESKTNNSFPILVVDDNLLQRTILESNLKAAGYEVVTADNGKKALEIYRQGYFPIVMTDWIMPEMNGLELCRAIRSDETGWYTFIILLTSLDSRNDIIAGLEAGADEYLIKPSHPVELSSRLKIAKRILELESSQKTYIEKIKSLSLMDPVTSIFNRSYLDEHLPQEIKRAYRYERPLSLMLININDIRKIVGSHGHYSGDMVLKSCAGCLSDSIRRDVDWLARYDEDSFIAILPETEVAGAMIVAKRLRLRIASTTIKIYEKEMRVTSSLGVAGFSPGSEKVGITSEMLLDKVNQCLVQAKNDGGESIKGVQLTVSGEK